MENVDLEWMGRIKIDLMDIGRGDGLWMDMAQDRLILAMLDFRVLLLKCGLANGVFKIVYKVSLNLN